MHITLYNEILRCPILRFLIYTLMMFDNIMGYYV